VSPAIALPTPTKTRSSVTSNSAPKQVALSTVAPSFRRSTTIHRAERYGVRGATLARLAQMARYSPKWPLAQIARSLLRWPSTCPDGQVFAQMARGYWPVAARPPLAVRSERHARRFCRKQRSSFGQRRYLARPKIGGRRWRQSAQDHNKAKSIGTGLVVIFWVVVAFLLAVIYGDYRLARRIWPREGDRRPASGGRRGHCGWP
jgi:hypothetical protein